jgi:mycothiol synthase
LVKVLPGQIDIRERTPDDLAVEVAIFNSVSPPDRQGTVEKLQRFESIFQREDKKLMLLAFAGSEAVGAGHGLRMAFLAEGRCELSVAVRPEFQRNGIGTALYQRLFDFAVSSGATEIGGSVREDQLPPIEAWLQREGFREVSRRRPSELRLDTFDFDRHASAEDRVLADGIQLVTLAGEDTPQNRRKLWELSNRTQEDVPFDVAKPDLPFDLFDRLIDFPPGLHDCQVIAKDGDRYVGFSLLNEIHPEAVGIGMTGVDRDYRGRGIATAVKVRSARLAHARGYRVMRTSNHTNNPPMLKVNDRLGFVARPQELYFVKSLVR